MSHARRPQIATTLALLGAAVLFAGAPRSAFAFPEIGGCKLEPLNLKGTWDCLASKFDKLSKSAAKSLAEAGKKAALAAVKLLPGGFGEAFRKLQKTIDCLGKHADKGFDVGKLVGDLLRNAGPALQSLLAQAWPLVSKTLGTLVSGAAPGRATVPKLLDIVWKQMENLGRKIGPLSCVVDLVAPLYRKARPLIAEVVGKVEKGIHEFVKKNVGPMVSKLAFSAIDWIIGQIGGEQGVKRLREIVASVLSAVDRLVGLGKKLAEVATAVKSNQGLAKAMEIAKGLGTKSDLFSAVSMVGVLQELLKEKAREFVHEKGGEVIDAILKSLSSVYNLLNRVIGSLCGLIPEVGGVICEVTLSAALRTSWTWLLSVQVKKLVLDQVNRWVEQAVDYLASVVREKFAKKLDAKTAALRQKLGAAARAIEGVAGKVIAFLKEYVQPAFAQMEAYQAKVKELADAALEAAQQRAAGLQK